MKKLLLLLFLLFIGCTEKPTLDNSVEKLTVAQNNVIMSNKIDTINTVVIDDNLYVIKDRTVVTHYKLVNSNSVVISGVAFFSLFIVSLLIGGIIGITISERS